MTDNKKIIEGLAQALKILAGKDPVTQSWLERRIDFLQAQERGVSPRFLKTLETHSLRELVSMDSKRLPNVGAKTKKEITEYLRNYS